MEYWSTGATNPHEDPNVPPGHRRVRCPFHPETEPSLEVNLQTGRYHCHHCGAEGVLTPTGESTLQMEFRWWSFI